MVTSAKSVDWEKVRQELKTLRNERFERFVKNPGEIRLAIEIRMLDDEMWECSEHLKRERKSHE